MGLDTVLTAIGEQIAAALDAAGIAQPGQVYKGWPTATEITKILAQPAPVQYMVSIFPHTARNGVRWIDEPEMGYVVPAAYVNATAVGNSLTISGSVLSGSPENIHALILGFPADVFVQAQVGDSENLIAANLANAVNALALAGVSAAAVMNAVLLSGAVWQSANVGVTGTYYYEATRVERTIQVTVWTTGDPVDPLNEDLSLRYAAGDAIISQIGTRQNHFITDSTGTVIFILYASDVSDDASKSKLPMYAMHIFFDIAYTVLATLPATQIGVVEPTTTVTTADGSQTKTQADFIGGQ